VLVAVCGVMAGLGVVTVNGTIAGMIAGSRCLARAISAASKSTSESVLLVADVVVAAVLSSAWEDLSPAGAATLVCIGTDSVGVCVGESAMTFCTGIVVAAMRVGNPICVTAGGGEAVRASAASSVADAVIMVAALIGASVACGTVAVAGVVRGGDTLVGATRCALACVAIVVVAGAREKYMALPPQATAVTVNMAKVRNGSARSLRRLP
jgi:hypothetical protein